MTDSRARAVDDSILRAKEARRAAQTLLDGGLYRDAVSRAYYAALHWVHALLHARGFESRSHAGAFSMLHRDFVQPGLLPSVSGWQLAGLQRSRELADYDANTNFSAAEVATLLGIVDGLAVDAAAILRGEGLLG